ncbi:hypothetical protein G6M89_05855 [Natronolimnobius sp. AArcel1]|uniref:hypothetical protein n=1 Tax=Natronolimnobius sp. AArcel1 TaxID=1679093 RepID=UPI0013ECB01F|nr:hypothetical protein [Natronolimnobius sp. AArcel1]NGM68540.1 hypothetical protein [Natronolimnobius sp. AArcel1]
MTSAERLLESNSPLCEKLPKLALIDDRNVIIVGIVAFTRCLDWEPNAYANRPPRTGCNGQFSERR